MIALVWLAIWLCAGGDLLTAIPLPDRLTCEILRSAVPATLMTLDAPTLETLCVSSSTGDERPPATRPELPALASSCQWGP